MKKILELAASSSSGKLTVKIFENFFSLFFFFALGALINCTALRKISQSNNQSEVNSFCRCGIKLLVGPMTTSIFFNVIKLMMMIPFFLNFKIF